MKTGALVWIRMALLAGFVASQAESYSVLTHEAIIDAAWTDSIVPVLANRFPGLSADQLVEAHAYAYGGAIVQDMGYYPFGSKLFSDLVHYIRSGDFVVALLRDAQDANQFAFAIGALAHYSSDISGHPIGVNHVVPMLYPKLRRKFGDPMTYEDNPGAHLKTEFGFDVVEVARGNYAPKSYHDFIGFAVSKPLLEKAFEETYAIALTAIFKDLDLALGTFRRAVSGLIPEMTKAAWVEKGREIGQATPGVTRRRFVYNLSRSSYEKEWGQTYERPGPGARVLAFFLRFLPKIGPLRALGFRVPTPAAETLFMRSFNETLTQYRGLTQQLRGGGMRLSDLNLDTGQAVHSGGYRLADHSCEKLLERLADAKLVPNAELKQSILAFYGKDAAAGLSEKARLELESLRR